jgi:Holliday junction resolvase RusA-like endonuclease
MINIEVDGEPIPWARPGHRRFKKDGKFVDIIYDKQKREKEMVQWQMRSQFKEEPLTVPLLVDLTFRMAIPKSTSAPIRREMLHGMYQHAKRPDIDNLTKFFLDCMNGLVFKDDSQISTLYCRKIYSSVPSTLIRIRPLSRNNPKELEEVINDEYSIRDDGSGDVYRTDLDKERTEIAGRKENRIITFRDE